MSAPRVPLTDPAFVYRNSASTDIRATFARERKRLAAEAAKAAPAKPDATVTPLRKAKP